MHAIRKFFRQHQVWVVSGGLLLLALGAFWYGILPAWKKITALAASRKTLVSHVVQLQKKVAVLEGLDEAALRSQLAAIVAAVPAEKAIPSAFSTVEGSAAQSGVTLGPMSMENPGSIATESARKLSAEEKKLGASTLLLTIQAQGTPDQLHDFFEALVSVRRSLRVRFFDVTMRAGSATLRAGIDAYYAAIPTSLGDALTSVEPLTPQEEATIQRVSAYPSYMVSVESTPVSVGLPRSDPFSF